MMNTLEKKVPKAFHSFDRKSNKIGIYFLFDKSSLMYIGQSLNIENRLFTHRKRKKGWNMFSYFECPRETLDIVESSLICFYRPPLNITVPRMVAFSKGGKL